MAYTVAYESKKDRARRNAKGGFYIGLVLTILIVLFYYKGWTVYSFLLFPFAIFAWLMWIVSKLTLLFSGN